MAATAAAFAEVTIDDPTLQLTWHPVDGAKYGFADRVERRCSGEPTRHRQRSGSVPDQWSHPRD